MNEQIKHYPLTHPQKGIWYMEKLHPHTSLGNIAGTVRINGEVDFLMLEKAITTVLQLNDSLHMRISEKDNEPIQYIADYSYEKLELFDFSNQGINALYKWDERQTKTPFDLLDSALYYFALIKVNDNEGGFYIKLHHLICDAWTIVSIVNSIIEYYSIFKNGDEISYEMKPSYSEFILREEDYLGSKKFINDREYWNSKFETFPEVTNLKVSNVNFTSTKSRRKTYVIPNDMSLIIHQYCENYKLSIFTFLFSVFAIYINRITSNNEIIVGTPILNRSGFREKKMLGMFVSTVPVRIGIDEKADFLSFANSVSKEWRQILRHCEYPYDILLKDIREKHKSIDNLYDIIFSYQNAKLNLSEYTSDFKSRWHFNGHQTNSLSIHINERDGSGSLVLDYDFLESAFTIKEIEYLQKHLLVIIQEVLSNPQKSISQIEIMEEDEKNRILYSFNSTKTSYREDKTVHQLFEEQVERTPDKIAVVCENRELTYKELNDKSNQLARVLRGNGAGPNSIIGIMAHRSIEMMIGIMAILKAGGAYLPIDPEYPEERIKFVLEDSGAKILLGHDNLIRRIEFKGEVVKFNSEGINGEDVSNLGIVNNLDDLSYVIYTSGSTGKPKGVMLTRDGLNNLLKGVTDIVDFSEGKTMVSITTVSFDIFIFETLVPLLKGLKVVLANEDERRIPRLLRDLMLRNSVDMIQTTPSRMQMLLSEENDFDHFKRLKEIVLGGEVLPLKLVERLRNITNARIYNGYGPTENTVYSTFKDVTRSERINIGKPISNTDIYILDKNLRPVPIGVAGELYIGGKGVAKGYLNRPELNAEKFIVNPFNAEGRLFKTGDLARWYPEGDIEYLGRIDFQVKIRGLRIELGEIESQILRYGKIKKTVVIDKEDASDKKYLCGYVVSDEEVSFSQLRAFLSKQLPAYMVPAYFMRIDKIPLNINGKINRYELPEPDVNLQISSDYVQPSNEMEKTLVAIWDSVLEADRIGIDDNFFELGGDSLSLVSVVMKIHREFDVEVPIEEIYKHPTIRELGEYIANAKKSIFKPIHPVEEREYYPMSSAQKRLFVLAQLEDDNVTYNMPGAFVVEGDFNTNRFEYAWKELINRHEILRTSFEMVDGEPMQRISKDCNLNIIYREAKEQEADGIIKNFVHPFDLSKAPLFRVCVIKLSENKHILLMDMHHIISDGASIDILLKELDSLYKGENLPELRVQYKDYSAWQNELFRSDYIKGQEEYWLNVFSGEIPVLNLPYDYARPSLKTYEGDSLKFYIDATLIDKVKKMVENTGATLYMVLLAAYNILMSKYSGQEDIIVGTPVACRRHIDIENVLGMFVNTLAMRNYPKGEICFLDFIEEVKQNSLKAYENQEYAFDDLVDRLNIKRDLSRNPLFDTMLVLQSVDVTKLKIGQLQVAPYPYNYNKSKFDMLLEAFETGSSLRFNVEFSTRLFRKATVERMMKHFISILEVIVRNPNVKLSDIGFLSECETSQLLNDFNNTERSYPSDKTIHQLFEKQAAETPEAAAVVSEEGYITYRELNERSNQLARMLRNQGMKPDTIAGIMMERSPEMIVSVLGVLKAGGAYVPIDPDYPEERIEYMLEDSKAEMLLVNNNLITKVDFKGKVIYVSNKEISAETASNLGPVNKSGDLLYVIYTSGSTGKPKGVMITHRNIVNLINHEYTSTNLDFKSRVLQFTTSSFDVCYQEIFSTLLSGGELNIVDNERKRNVLELLGFIEKHGINVVFLPPAYLKLIISNEELLSKISRSVKHIIVAGEQLIVTEQFKEYLKANKVYLHNHYGPSETHVVTTFTVDPDGDIPVLPSIGKPISNTRIYILDKNNRLQPMGVAGELCISGDSVGRGYINRSELTTEKFIQSPFAPGELMYKTGDLARWMPDGNIEFLGRIDHQVKIRGFRIELGEIESQLLNHESISEAVVLVRQDVYGNKYLCAYVVSDKEQIMQELRHYLLERLPDYMIPAHFIRLDNLPLTPNGKINKNALPEPIGNKNEGIGYEEPKGSVEKELSEIWSEVLHVEKIGRNDNFFDLGGDSLLVIQAQIKALNYNWGLSTQDFYQYQTIKEMAVMIKKGIRNDEANKVDVKDGEVKTYFNEIIKEIEEVAATSEGEPDKIQFRNVLITGATGYLGIHVLNEVLADTEADAYCLVRGIDQKAVENRLAELLSFYFPDRHIDLIGKRIHVVNGDITMHNLGLSEKMHSELGSKIDTMIHTAANVRHYGNYSDFERINIRGTEEVIKFALAYDIPLNHISTIGVSGTHIVQKNESERTGTLFTEKDFYIGQNYTESVYIKSKFESENLVYKAMKSGLRATVFRIGNLTGRYSDGHFQPNISENAFYNRIKSIIELKTVPEDMLEQKIEFTPVDYCSKALVRLISSNGYKNIALHLFNHNRIKIKDLFEVFEALGIDVKPLKKNEFTEYVKFVSTDKNKQDILQGIIVDFSQNQQLDYNAVIIPDSEITQRRLTELGFKWPMIDSSYIVRLMKYMHHIGYIQLPEIQEMN